MNDTSKGKSAQTIKSKDQSPLNNIAEFPKHELLDSGRSWVIAAVGFISLSVGFGMLYTFGAFIKPLTEAFMASRKATSLLFSITVALTFLFGPFTGYLTEKFGTRLMLTIGALAMGCGLVGTAIAKSLWLAYLTYGFAIGFSVACIYVPTLTLISGWFDKWRDSALGFAVAGIGCGTLMLVPGASFLVERFGWRKAYLILGVGGASVLALCALLAAPAPIRPSRSRPSGIPSALRTTAFMRLYLGTLFFQIAQFIPLAYLADFARTLGISPVASGGLIGFIGAASLTGRFLFAALGNRFDALSLYKTAALIFLGSNIIWLNAHQYQGLVAFALTMGASYGGFVALSPAVVTQLFGTEGLGRVLGTFYTSAAFGVLTGPPFAGWLIDHSGSFRAVIIFAVSMATISTAILAGLKAPTNYLNPRSN